MITTNATNLLCTKLLGIMIDDNLKWDSQIKNIQTKKISLAFGLLKYAIYIEILKYAKLYIQTSTLNYMDESIVAPYLNYS